KPFTLSAIQPLDVRPGHLLPITPFEVLPAKTYWFRITSCNERLTQFLIEYLYNQKEVKFPHLLNCPLNVKKVIIDQTEHEWAGQTSWSSLIQQVLTEVEIGNSAKTNKIGLFFNSPTTFKQSGKPLPLILPLPEQTFSSLIRYWNEASP